MAETPTFPSRKEMISAISKASGFPESFFAGLLDDTLEGQYLQWIGQRPSDIVSGSELTRLAKDFGEQDEESDDDRDEKES